MIETKVFYPQADEPIFVKSPDLVGHADVDCLGRLLDGENSRLVFPTENDLAFPPDYDPQHPSGELVGILINDGPPHAPQVTRMVVAEWPLKAQLFPGVILERMEKMWGAYLGVWDEVTANTSVAFLIREPWVKVLHGLVRDELGPFMQFAWDFTKPSHAKIGREITSRCNYYSANGVSGFFSTPQRFMDWSIAASWPLWGEEHASVSERIRDLHQLDPPVEITASVFRKVCKRLELALPAETRRAGNKTPTAKPETPIESDENANLHAARREPELVSLVRTQAGAPYRRLSEFNEEELETIAIAGSYPAAEEAVSLAEREMALIRDWSPQNNAVFSYGGSPALSFDLDPAISDEFPGTANHVTLHDLVEKVWWWKSLVKDFAATTAVTQGRVEKSSIENARISKWSSELPDEYALFRDNWTRSAFFYEFRARYKGRYRWDFFGKPWVKLNNTERGILACMWPPKELGPNTLQPSLHPLVLKRLKAEVVTLIARRSLPPGRARLVAVAQLTKRLKEQGFAPPKRGSGGRKMPSWRALQFLDVQHYLGRKIPGTVTKLQDATRTYLEACKEFGINP